MIRQISIINWVTTTILTVALFLLATPQQAIGCFIAGSIVGVNLIAIVWSLQKIFQKKSVALAVSVIVIKYAALLGIFIFLYLIGWKVNSGFVIGLSSLFPTLGILAYQHFIKSE